ncbi:MAG: hypothetical protein OHK0029_27520 [Armatimonadaceae bacterium]
MVKIVFTKVSGSNAVLSGLFVDPSPVLSGNLSQRFSSSPGEGRLIGAVGSSRLNQSVSRVLHTDALGSVKAVSRGEASTTGVEAVREASKATTDTMRTVLLLPPVRTRP